MVKYPTVLFFIALVISFHSVLHFCDFVIVQFLFQYFSVRVCMIQSV